MLNEMMIGVLSITFNRAYTIPDYDSSTAVTLKAEDLDKYLGVYSSPQLPIKITISKNKNTLMGQATGQGAFALEATKADEFKVEALNVSLTFDVAKDQMTFKQNGATFIMTREK